MQRNKEKVNNGLGRNGGSEGGTEGRRDEEQLDGMAPKGKFPPPPRLGRPAAATDRFLSLMTFVLESSSEGGRNDIIGPRQRRRRRRRRRRKESKSGQEVGWELRRRGEE